MRNSLLLALAVLVAVAGCQQRRFTNVGKDKDGREYGMLLKSVDEYAKKEGLSREEAIRQLRQQADAAAIEAAAQGQTCRACTAGASPPAGAGGPVAYQAEDADRAYGVRPAAHVDAPVRENPLRR